MSEHKSETAEQWFSVGNDDLFSAEALLEAGIYRNVCFLSQQAVEKYVKGSLVQHQKSFPKTHFLSELVALLQSIQPELVVDRTDIDLLDSYYIEPRYPDAYFETYTKEEADEALKIAKNMIEKLKT